MSVCHSIPRMTSYGASPIAQSEIYVFPSISSVPSLKHFTDLSSDLYFECKPIKYISIVFLLSLSVIGSTNLLYIKLVFQAPYFNTETLSTSNTPWNYKQGTTGMLIGPSMAQICPVSALLFLWEGQFSFPSHLQTPGLMKIYRLAPHCSVEHFDRFF